MIHCCCKNPVASEGVKEKKGPCDTHAAKQGERGNACNKVTWPPPIVDGGNTVCGQKIVNQLLVEKNKSGVGSEEIRGLSGVFLEEQYSYSDSRLVVNTPRAQTDPLTGPTYNQSSSWIDPEKPTPKNRPSTPDPQPRSRVSRGVIHSKISVRDYWFLIFFRFFF